MMQFAHAHLRNVEGLQFYKLLGSGKAGFDPRPDWSVYALLQVWDDETTADKFFENSELLARYKQRSTAQYTLFLKNKIARGKWAGQTPFVPHKDLSESIPQIAVITRATIKTKFLRTVLEIRSLFSGALMEKRRITFYQGNRGGAHYADGNL